MSTTRHRAGFETGNHSSSPLQGAITRGALHVPQRTPTEGRHTASQKRKRKRKRKRALVAQSLGVSVQNHASAGGKKKVDRDVCAGRGAPKNLRRQSEVSTGSLALTAQVRSEWDHSEREHADHRKDPSTLKKDRACSSCPSPVSVAHCRASGKKREALAAAQEGKMVRCIARGPSKRQAPHASFAQSPLVPAQPPGRQVFAFKVCRT